MTNPTNDNLSKKIIHLEMRGQEEIKGFKEKDVREAVKRFLHRDGSLSDLGIDKKTEDEIFRRIKNKIGKIFGEALTGEELSK